MAIPQPKFTIENNIIKGEKKIDPVQSRCIGDIILQVLKDKPNHVFQVEVATGAETTYAEMRKKCVSCSLWLRKQGIGSNDVVAVCTGLQANDYIPVIASLLAGAIYNPWHHEVNLKTARHLMSLTQPKVIFACASAMEVLRDAARLEGSDARIVCYDKCPDSESLEDIISRTRPAEIEAYEPEDPRKPEDVAMILFSSGTTGLPKGVSYSCRVIKSLLSGISVVPSEFTKLLWYSSLYWVSGTFFLLQVAVGSKTRILHASFDPESTSRVIDEFQVEWFFIPPALVTHFCKSKVLERRKLDSLKFFLTGGAKLGREFIAELKRTLTNTAFLQAYGMTESGGLLTLQTKECTKIESVGFVLHNTEMKIADLASGKALGPNQAGEVCFKTQNAMVGYYRNPKATQEMIDDEGWYHTGDKGYYMENGELMIVDRLKEVMKYRGHQIAPSEIEEHLTSHKAVMEAAVVPLPHDLDLEVPMAFVKKTPGAKVTEEELVKYSCELGEIKKLRGGVKFLDQLPHTASGKINRKLLKELAIAYSN